jgi:hypothetical protein
MLTQTRTAFVLEKSRNGYRTSDYKSPEAP